MSLKSLIFVTALTIMGTAQAAEQLQASDAHFFADGVVPSNCDTYLINYNNGHYTGAGSRLSGGMVSMRKYHKPLEAALQKFMPSDASLLLELGPLYIPQFHATQNTKVVYWEKDIEALRTLEASTPPEISGNAVGMHSDFNGMTPEYEQRFLNWNERVLASDPHGKYKAVVISQVLNYVDYKKVLGMVAKFQGPGDLLFSLNGVDVGDRKLFPENHPKHDDDVENYLVSLGYEIIYKDLEFPTNSNGIALPNPSTTLVARKKGH